MLNLIPSDLQETRFQTEWLQQITKTRGADKSQNKLKKCVKIQPTSMQNRSQSLTKKRCLKTDANKSTTFQKMTPNWDPKSEGILGNASWSTFGGFVIKNGLSALPKCSKTTKK